MSTITWNGRRPVVIPRVEVIEQSLPRRSRAELIQNQLSHAMIARGLPRLAAQVSVEFCPGGQVLLNGQVRSFYLKQMAQEIAAAHPEVHQVQNRLTVAGFGQRAS